MNDARPAATNEVAPIDNATAIAVLREIELIARKIRKFKMKNRLDAGIGSRFVRRTSDVGHISF